MLVDNTNPFDELEDANNFSNAISGAQERQPANKISVSMRNEDLA